MLLAAMAVGAGPAAGCGDAPFEPAMQYRMIGLAEASNGVCPDDDLLATPAIDGATSVRMTFMDRGANTLRCDVVIALDGPPTVISVPGADAPVDLVVEYVADDGSVRGRGRTDDIELAVTSAVDVRIRAASAFACAPERAAEPRAFHSATALPDGELLLIGGLAGAAGAAIVDPATGFFLQPRAEIYSPASGESRVVTIPGLTPRAFHQAYLLGVDGDGVMTIAVLGGLTVTGDPATTPVAVVGINARIQPGPAALGAAGEILRYDPATTTFTRTPIATAADVEARAFGALSGPGAGAAIADIGGLDLTMAGAPAKLSVDQVDPVTGNRITTVASRRGRVGATVTGLAPDQLLVWGGDPTGADGAANPEVGELLVGWNAAPSSQPLTIDTTGELGTHRAYHAAALAGDNSVIIAGGFGIATGGVATEPAAATVQRVAFAMGMQRIVTLADNLVATPAGYGAAVRVSDGDVLLAGGNPEPIAQGCAPDHLGLVCTIAEAWRYDSAAGTLARTGNLGVGRYGHLLTTVADGTVIATGGLARDAATLRAVVDVEVYEPRGAGDDPLLPELVREPGDVARTGGGEPLAPCAVVVVYADAAP